MNLSGPHELRQRSRAGKREFLIGGGRHRHSVAPTTSPCNVVLTSAGSSCVKGVPISAGDGYLLLARRARTEDRPMSKVVLRDSGRDIDHQVALLDDLGIAAVTTDLHGTISHWNEAAAGLYGRPGHTMIGTSIGCVGLCR